jgi:threonine aldolase
VTRITGKSFGSDNHAGVHPAVLAAIAAANAAAAAASLCERTGAVSASLVFTGTAANVLGLSLLVRPYEGAICAESSHLNVDECGAAERVLGCKLLPEPAPDGKVTPSAIERRLSGIGDEHRVQPRVVQIAQVTETGTCYSLAELRELRQFCQQHDLLVLLDGARIANAAAYLDCSLAEIAAFADVLTFGGTKNGALGVEAVLVMVPGVADGVQYYRKQQMQLASKMRFLSAQVNALLADDLWLANARHANAMAARLATAISGIPGVELAYPVQSNGVFASLGREHARRLQEDWNFHIWAAFDTTAQDTDALAAAVKATAR